MNLDDEIEKFIKGFSEEFKEKMKAYCCPCDGEDEEDEEEEDEKIASIKEDYSSCMQWAFKSDNAHSRAHALKKWKKNHPDLPVPRVLEADQDMNQHFSSVALVMDIYPLWLESQK